MTARDMGGRVCCHDCEHSTIKSPNGVKYAPNHSYCKIGHGDHGWARLPLVSLRGGPAPKWCPVAKAGKDDPCS